MNLHIGLSTKYFSLYLFMVKISYNNTQHRLQQRRQYNVRIRTEHEFKRIHGWPVFTARVFLTVHFNLRQTLCLLRVTGKIRRIRLFFGPFSRESQFQNLTISRRSDQLPTCNTVQMQNSVPTRKAIPRTIHGAASLALTKQRYATAAANNITLERRRLIMWRCARV